MRLKKDKSIKLSLIDTLGKLCYTGNMETEGDKRSFSIDAVKGAFVAAATIKGSYHLAENSLEFAEANLGTRIEVKARIPSRAS